MEIIKLPGMNRELAPPGGWDAEKHGECLPLPVFAEVSNGGMHMTSAWRPSAEELVALNAGGAVAMTIFGTLHPPIALGVFAVEDVPQRPGIQQAVDKLRAVLCDPNGTPVVGAPGDSIILLEALCELEAWG